MSSFEWMRYVGAVLAGLGITGLGVLFFVQPQSPIRISWARYEAHLEKEARFLMKKYTGKQFARRQLLVCLALVIIPYALSMYELYLILPIAMLAPVSVLRSEHEKRVLEIEASLDSWLLMLSNALKATPSLGEAMSSSAKLMRPPLSEELDLMLKEVALGTAIDKAITNGSTRIGSRVVSTALATILVGRQTGGDLSRILEESAATLREMARLEGVVRTKTAEGRSQATVLGAMPFFVVGALYLLDPEWMAPLFSENMGKMLLFIAFCLWVGAIALANRILKVDI